MVTSESQSVLRQSRNHTLWRETEQFRIADKEGKLVRLPTGDNMALVFRNTPEAPVRCALELSKRLQAHPELRAFFAPMRKRRDEILANDSYIDAVLTRGAERAN